MYIHFSSLNRELKSNVVLQSCILGIEQRLRRFLYAEPQKKDFANYRYDCFDDKDDLRLYLRYCRIYRTYFHSNTQTFQISYMCTHYKCLTRIIFASRYH